MAPLDKDVPAARPAAQADVRAEPIDQPRVAAARVRATEANDVAEQEGHGGLVSHRRVRVSKARVTMGRDERPGRRGELQAVDRGDRDDHVRLGGGELRDHAAGSGQ